MLRWFDSDSNLTLDKIPHRKEYDNWLSRLSPDERDEIIAHIESLIKKGDVRTSSWMPGPNWIGTPLHAIYEKAARMSEEQAGWCFGLMLMEAMIERPEQWYCKKDPEVAEGTIYWRA